MKTNISDVVAMALSGKKIGFTEYLAKIRIEVDMAVAMIGHIDHIAIVKHRHDDRWQMILPDVSGGDFWRTQSFDLNGFSGHCVFDTKDKAIRNAATMNFTIRDDDALDRIQDTPEFQSGLFAVEQIALLNQGQIDFREYTSRIVSYRGQLLEVAMH